MRLARPRSFSVMFSSLSPSSSEIARAAGQDRDIFEHRLAPIAEARRLDRDARQRAANLVDDQGRQRLAFDILGDNQERLAGLGNRLENRQQVLHRGDLLLVDQDEHVFELRFHPLRIGHEVRRQVAAVELHPLDHFELGLESARLFNRDDAFLADFLHRLGNDVADGRVVVGRDRADLRDFLAILGRLGQVLELGGDRLDRAIDSALERHRIVPRGDHLDALGENLARQHGGGGGAVAGDVGGLGSDFFDHLRAHVLELVFELDFLGDGDAVLGHGRRAEALLQHDVAALGAERHGDGIGEDIDPLEDLLARFLSETNYLCRHGSFASPKFSFFSG